jgi:hypothetical protein
MLLEVLHDNPKVLYSDPSVDSFLQQVQALLSEVSDV